MAYTCLIVERDRSLSRSVEREFPGYGFRPYPVQSSPVALNLLQQWRFDAVLLDADSLGAGYVDVLQRLRRGSTAPVVMMSSASDEQGRLLGLESGATSVIVKPASSRLICAAMTRLIESAGPKSDEVDPLTQLGPLLMDPKRGLAFIADVPLKLTVHEFELLHMLASRPGQFVDRESIVRVLRGNAESIGRGVDVHVYRIRRKFKEHHVDALRLDTIYGRGYCLTVREPQPDGGTDGARETSAMN